MKASDVRSISREERVQKLEELTEELFNLRFQHATGQLENTMRIPQTKREIARLKTVIREMDR